MDLEGKGRGICYGAEYVLALASILAPASISIGSSMPLLKVIALTFPFGLIIGCVEIFQNLVVETG